MVKPTIDPWPDRDSHASGEGAAFDVHKRMETRDIFRELIASEVRAGRLTNGRRKRIIRYAAQLGLSAVETGRLIDQCRRELAPDSEGFAPTPSLRIAPAKQSRIPAWVKIWIVVVLALAADWTLLRWIW